MRIRRSKNCSCPTFDIRSGILMHLKPPEFDYPGANLLRHCQWKMWRRNVHRLKEFHLKLKLIKDFIYL